MKLEAKQIELSAAGGIVEVKVNGQPFAQVADADGFLVKIDRKLRAAGISRSGYGLMQAGVLSASGVGPA